MRGYRRSSLGGELETAAALLVAAGIATRLELPATGLPETVAPACRAALRTALTRLLRERAGGCCTITATAAGEQVRPELRTEGSAETIEVAA